jgi:hypothetical protein
LRNFFCDLSAFDSDLPKPVFMSLRFRYLLWRTGTLRRRGGSVRKTLMYGHRGRRVCLRRTDAADENLGDGVGRQVSVVIKANRRCRK